MSKYSTHDVSTVEIDRALEKKYCPVCRIMRLTMEKYIWNLLYAFTCEPEVHQMFKKSMGFCKKHSQLAVALIKKRKLISGTSLARLYTTTIPSYIDTMEQIGSSGIISLVDRIANLFHSDTEHADGSFSREECRACKIENGNRRLSISILAKKLAEDEYRKAYKKSDGLCQPHLEELIGTLKTRREGRAVIPFLIAEHKKRLEHLKELLVELQRKKKYDVKESTTPEEAVSWEEAVWRFTGWEPTGLLTRD